MSNVIPRKKLSDFVSERLLKLIDKNQLKPGDRLPSEKEMMAMYQVGRSVVREAVHNLKNMGLIEIRHGERPRIVNPCLNEISEKMAQSLNYLIKFSEINIYHLKETRKIFEIGVVKLAAIKRTEEDLQYLSEILDNHREMIGKSSSSFAKYDELVKYDRLFHRRIAKISGNPIFESLSKSFFTWVSILHSDTECKVGIEMTTLREHENIFNAIEESNPEQAEKYMIEHLDSSKFLNDDKKLMKNEQLVSAEKNKNR